MKILLDINEDDYKAICKKVEYFGRGSCVLSTPEKTIFNGTPLKEHGRLIDAEKLYNQIDKLNCGDDKGKYTGILSLITLTPTIIEADNGE